MIVSVLLLAALQAAPVVPSPGADAGVARLQTLTIAGDGACTADRRWCVGLVLEIDGETQVIRPVVRPGGEALPAAPENETFPNETYQPWDGLVRLADGGFLAGVEAGISSMYSGGGGQASELRLFRLNAAGEASAAPVLIAPLRGSLLIRACFSEADMKRRAGACHDEYSFGATLKLASGSAGDPPALDYAATATAFPRGVSRSRDSLEAPPLTQDDLVAAQDSACSYERRFVFDAASGVYRPDQPLPDCSNYTVP